MIRGLLSRRDRAELIGIACLAVFVLCLTTPPLAVAAFVSPEDIESGRVTLTGPCPYRAKYGVPCTSCGLTRGFAAMARGRIGQARDYNPWAPWLFAGTGLCALSAGYVMSLCVRRWRSLRPNARTAP
ncbi:MAG: DUF2752 domain-containing protein [Polyangiaceae bacterium]